MLEKAQYTDEYLKKIQFFGAIGYDVYKIKNLLDIENPKQFRKEFFTMGSAIWNAYKKGKDSFDLNIDKILVEKIKSGDIDALEILQNRKIIYKAEENSISQILEAEDY